MATPLAASTRTRRASGAGKTTVARRGYPTSEQIAVASRGCPCTATATAAPEAASSRL